MPVKFAGSGDNVSSTIRYVALGDSIAYGYGLSDRESDSYVGQVGKYLEKKYDYVFSGHSHMPHFFEKYYKTDNCEYRNRKKTIFIK